MSEKPQVHIVQAFMPSNVNTSIWLYKFVSDAWSVEKQLSMAMVCPDCECKPCLGLTLMKRAVSAALDKIRNGEECFYNISITIVKIFAAEAKAGHDHSSKVQHCQIDVD